MREKLKHVQEARAQMKFIKEDPEEKCLYTLIAAKQHNKPRVV